MSDNFAMLENKTIFANENYHQYITTYQNHKTQTVCERFFYRTKRAEKYLLNNHLIITFSKNKKN